MSVSVKAVKHHVASDFENEVSKFLSRGYSIVDSGYVIQKYNNEWWAVLTKDNSPYADLGPG